jgi:hypothetical protein
MLKNGGHLRDAATVKPPVGASAITIALESTFIRGCGDSELRLEVRVDNVEASGHKRCLAPQQSRDRHHRLDFAEVERAQSTMARPVPGSGIDLTGPPNADMTFVKTA